MAEEVIIDVDFLINLVEARPVLWDKTINDFKNRDLTRKAWEEVCTSLNKDYEDLDGKQKDAYYKEVVKRWGNLRDSYSRAEKRVKATKTSGSAAKKKKHYIYQDEMSFLSKLNEQRGTVDSLTEEAETPAEDVDYPAVFDDSFTPEENGPAASTVNGPGTSTAKESSMPQKHQVTRKHKKLDEVEVKMLEALKPKEKEKPDSNMNFFMSLIPHIQSYNASEILQFQMGVLQVISDINNRKLYFPQNNTTPPPYMSAQTQQYSQGSSLNQHSYNQHCKSYQRAQQPQFVSLPGSSAGNATPAPSPSTPQNNTTPSPYISAQTQQYSQGSSLNQNSYNQYNQSYQRAQQSQVSSPGSSTDATPVPSPSTIG